MGAATRTEIDSRNPRKSIFSRQRGPGVAWANSERLGMKTFENNSLRGYPSSRFYARIRNGGRLLLFFDMQAESVLLTVRLVLQCTSILREA